MEKVQKEKRGRGRPAKEKAKLTHSINLKLTERDFETIRQKAESIGMTATQYAREMTLRSKIKPRYTKEELDLRRKLAGIANNINQIAGKAHSEGFMKAAVQGIMVLNQLKQLLDDNEK